jgi:hypothetical protein
MPKEQYLVITHSWADQAYFADTWEDVVELIKEFESGDKEVSVYKVTQVNYKKEYKEIK